MNRATLLQRFRIILINGASRVLSVLGTPLVSLIIVRSQGAEVWGSAVPSVLLLDFGFSIIGWGSNPYLIREFSLEPRNISKFWSESIIGRIPLLIGFTIVVIFLPLSMTLKGTMLAWALARYVYQAQEPLLQYHKNFLFSLLLETTSFVLIVIPIFAADSPMTAEFIIALLASAMVWKSVLSSVFIHSKKLVRLSPTSRRDVIGYYAAAFPFLLLTFSGMLQQRMDLYLVAFYLDDRQTAVYQVLINWLIFCQFLASLFLSPFSKNIFRLAEESLLKLQRNFMLLGIVLAAVSILGVYTMMSLVYRFELSIVQYALGYFYILMTYLYLLRNYDLGKRRKQTLAAVFSFAASLMNLLVGIYCIPRFGITGALLAGTIAQAFLVILYHTNKYNSNKPVYASR
jgi:O-antigen/teichoic acid export membrane protein